MKIIRITLASICCALFIVATLSFQDHLRFYAGNFQFSRGNYRSACRHYQALLAHPRISVWAQYNLANCVYARKSAQQAEENWLAIVNSKQPPKHVVTGAVYNLGVVAYQAGQYTAAHAFFLRALQSNPQDVRIKRALEFAERLKTDEQNTQPPTLSSAKLSPTEARRNALRVELRTIIESAQTVAPERGGTQSVEQQRGKRRYFW